MMINQTKDNFSRAIWYANVLQFIPDMELNALARAYEIWNRNRIQFAQLYEQFILGTVSQGPASKNLRRFQTGKIVITFHYGPYRLLPRLLLKKGCQVTLLASSNVLTRELESYWQEVVKAKFVEENFNCIDASLPTSLQEVVKAVRQGRWVVIFLDANEGAALTKGNYTKVPLFESAVYFRTNIFKVAERFSLPIAVAHVSPSIDGSLWRFYMEDLSLEDTEEVGQYADRAQAAVFVYFVKMIHGDWMLWENWSLLHRYDPNCSNGTELTLGEPIAVVPLQLKGKNIFLDISNRQFFEFS